LVIFAFLVLEFLHGSGRLASTASFLFGDFPRKANRVELGLLFARDALVLLLPALVLAPGTCVEKRNENILFRRELTS